MSKKYQMAALGGTFDHLHLGHQFLLDTAFLIAEKVVIGIVHDASLSQKHCLRSLQTFKDRKAALNSFLLDQGYSDRFQLHPLHDIYGPTLTNTEIDLLVITSASKPGANKVNTKRIQTGLAKLPLHQVDLIKDDTGTVLSSSRIRQGIVDRSGHIYSSIFDQPITPSVRLRQIINQPQGKVVNESDLNSSLFKSYQTVTLLGDQVTEYCISDKLPFNYAVIDYLINRHPHKTNLNGFQPEYTTKTSNTPGTISPSATKAIKRMLEHRSGLLTIAGEEDLLGFPLVSLLPLNSLLIYGQPGSGVVLIEVNEAEKVRLTGLIKE